MNRALDPNTRTKIEQLFIDEGIGEAYDLSNKVMQIIIGETPDPPTDDAERAALKADINADMIAYCKRYNISVLDYARSYVLRNPGVPFVWER